MDYLLNIFSKKWWKNNREYTFYNTFESILALAIFADMKNALMKNKMFNKQVLKLHMLIDISSWIPQCQKIELEPDFN